MGCTFPGLEARNRQQTGRLIVPGLGSTCDLQGYQTSALGVIRRSPAARSTGPLSLIIESVDGVRIYLLT